MIQVGQGAATDPLLNFTSAVATQLLADSMALSPKRRIDWIRDDLNKATPGLGDDFVSKSRELARRGRRQDQAVFDALRLVLANRIANRLPAEAAQAGLAGLGGSTGDINATFCGVNGTVGGGAVIVSSLTGSQSTRTEQTTAVGNAMASILQAQGCSNAQMQQQLAMQQQLLNTMAGQQGTVSAGVTASSSAIPWIVGGVAALGLVGVLGYMAVRKK